MSAEDNILKILDRIAAAMSYMLEQSGVSVEQFVSMMSAHAVNSSPADQPRRTGQSLTLEQAHFLSDLVGEWHRHPDYVDDVGEPRVLTVKSSKPSFQSLCQLVANQKGSAPDSSPEQLLHFLIANQAVEMTDDGLARVIDRTFFYNRSGLGLAMQLSRLAVYAETVEHNTRNEGGRFDKAATVADLPADAIPLINKFLYENGMQFLQEADDFMESIVKNSNSLKRQPQAQSDDESLRLTVGLYLARWSDDLKDVE